MIWAWLKRGLKIVIYTILLTTAIVGLLDYWVSYSTKSQRFDSTSTIPYNPVGLLLGTSKYLSTGQPNLYYRYRIEAAVTLYQAGKIRYVLVSGDNRTHRYNEPVTIQKDLIAAGIPKEAIYLDYAGFRTLDSVVRSQKVFEQNQITIISQPFHNARALFIANAKGIDAVAFNAQDVPFRYGLKVSIRERLARVKMHLDLLVGVTPKFLGEPVPIPTPTPAPAPNPTMTPLETPRQSK